MRNRNWEIIFAVFLMAFGGLFLLSNLNILPFAFNTERVFWLAAFGVGGLGFLAAFLSSVRNNWWAAIPGFTLLGLAGLIGLPVLQNAAGGAFFLAMIGLSFWVIFFVHREFWWAIIPGGALFSVAVTAALGEVDGAGAAGALFLGLALTFLIIYLLPTPQGRMLWAIWPAGVLGVIGALIMSGSTGALRYAWPVVLILVGGLLIFRAMQRREGL